MQLLLVSSLVHYHSLPVTMKNTDTTVPPGSAEVPAAIPPLPENATPEEKDAHWFKHVYAGDKVPQLTLRAVLMGGILGMVMSLSNLYTMLQLGWLFGVGITACVLSFLIWNSLRALSGGRLRAMSILENNCMQSTASAAGYTTGSTVGTAFGALLLITGSHQPWYYLAPFILFSASLGVFIAIPMKRQMINYEQLKFPSGIAAAETLRSLYSRGVEALHKAYSLVIALVLGGLIGLLRTWGTLVDQFKQAGRPQVWLEKVQAVFRILTFHSQGGKVATILECADLSALSAGDLSPSNAGRRPTFPSRWTRLCSGDKVAKAAKAVTSHRTPNS